MILISANSYNFSIIHRLFSGSIITRVYSMMISLCISIISNILSKEYTNIAINFRNTKPQVEYIQSISILKNLHLECTYISHAHS